MKDLGVAKKILGMQIHRERGANKLRLSQISYVEGVLIIFDMSKAKPVSLHLQIILGPRWKNVWRQTHSLKVCLRFPMPI